VDGDIPNLPAGREVDLPGRGRTWVFDSDPDGLASGAAGAGGGPGALVLLHGWTSTAALNWCRCLAPLGRHYRVIAPDHRGHGRGIRSRRPFRLEDCADDAAAVIDHLATGPVTAVGYSMGGPIAQLLWQRRPDLVKGLVLCATAARFSVRAELNGPVGALGYGVSLALSGLPAGLLRPGYEILIRNRAAEQQVSPWAVSEWERNDPVALVQAGFALSRFDSTEWIGAIDVPTSVVVTTRDATVEPTRQWHLARSIPGATAFPVAVTHRGCVDQAERFVPALLAACQAADRPGVPAVG
jgi:3-oxoadipate enol-lactonase